MKCIPILDPSLTFKLEMGWIGDTYWRYASYLKTKKIYLQYDRVGNLVSTPQLLKG